MNNTWEDKHSVNCIKCGVLFDERDGFTPSDGEGTVCPSCFDKDKIWEELEE
jgi:Zn ribbon nucleic-acid-binding protein